MHRSARATAVALVALIVAMLAPDAASGVPRTFYIWLTCNPGTSTTGHINSTSFYPVENWDGSGFEGEFTAEFSVSLTPCKKPVFPQVWGLAAYRDTHGWGVPQPYNGSSNLIDIDSGVQAMCLIANETTRLECVAVGWVDVGGVLRPVNEGPLPVDSPRVDMRAVTVMLIPPPGPGCTTCP
ncbi:hypothetical protein [Catellatospora methionotrophica]|uniref:hypothetical protein n=1 Tax=Catellatospora methionotrophica TaxID=121620 RepID=UPI0033D1B844